VPDLSLEGETLANDYHWRSTKAKKQLRDRFGRWISLGANVRFRGDGVEQTGVVTSVVDGKAYVDQKNRDGTVTQKIVLPGQIRVIASKATLPQDDKKIFDKDNDFKKALQKPEVRKALDEEGSAYIERADGYALAANIEDEAQGLDNEIHDGSEVKNKDGGNPIAYQLFAPGGRSMGLYGEAAVDDFDEMVNDDIASSGDKPVSTGDTEAAPVIAPTGEQAAPAAVAASVEVVGEEKPFRVPEAVREEIRNSISSMSSSDVSDKDVEVARRLANDATVSLSDVQWIHAYFCDNETAENLRGGFKGRKWASKIVDSGDEIVAPDDIEVSSHPKYSFDDDIYAYFAVGSTPGSTLVNSLLSVNYETGSVYAWGPEGFDLIPNLDMKEVDEPQIIPIDEMTADEFAHLIDSGVSEEYDILDTNPEERNLFTLAESEIDYDELDEAYSIIAAAGDGVYTPIERSQNAKVQARGAGGKFGSVPDAAAPAEVPEAQKPSVKKATLPLELPLVENVGARIQEWLSTAAEAPVVAAAEPEYTPEDQAVEDAATGPDNEALYFAIVDEIDKTAVLDAVAIVKQNGQPSAFIRTGGQWTASPDTLVLLQGNTPPAVVELPDPETVKTVLEQIDAHDSGADQTEVTEEDAPKEGEVAIAASAGYALPDGSYSIIGSEDIQNAVELAGESPDIFVKAHIRKRARALNRMDLVPAKWREFTLAEIGELSASQTVYGEFGEIIVASGVPGVADTPSDFKNVAKLQAYWTHGKGALKIRWGTKGDLTRAHRHLSKYVGPQRAWGLAQKYHKSLFGVYNHTHDVATGQYVPRRRKK
jgi:hypothetical protein